ncbi:MAG: phage holin family protein [Pseudomonadota bacterium]
MLESIGRLGATLVAVLQTRLELAAVEVEEESLRYLGYLLMSLLALFLFGIAIVLLAFFVILLFWDSHRIEAVLGLALLFGVGSAVLGARVRAAIGSKPRLLAHTFAELNKDIDFVKNASQSHEP